MESMEPLIVRLMDINTLLQQYFPPKSLPTIDVFDAETIYAVYHKVVTTLTRHLFNFIQFGENLGTRQLGAMARNCLVPLLQSEDKVVLDFSGVDVVSNSFADECIAKLLLQMPLEELKQRTTFRGLNTVAHNSVLTAIQRRYRVMRNA